MKNYPVSRKENLVVQEMDDEVLIYDLIENKAFCLNETSAAIWQSCDGERTVEKIMEEAAKSINAPMSEDIVWLALEQLATERLVENVKIPVSAFAGMSRRDVIKRVGLGSMAALPIVASMTAPLAIQAQSACGVAVVCQCNTLMGAVNGEICATSPDLGDGGVDCPMGCRCQRANMGNADGICIV